MCGRYTVSLPTQQMAEELNAELASDAMPPRWNVAPTQDAPILVVRASRRIGPARFGLVPPDSAGPGEVRAKYINLRSEGLSKQKRFAPALAQRRCLVLADGFYEWDGSQPKRKPWYIHPKAAGVLTLAGIYEVWSADEGDEKLLSFSILTMAARGVVAPLHGRMPVIVPAALRDDWVDPSAHDGRSLIYAVRDAEAAELESYRVDARVGNARIDEPGLNQPIEEH